MAEQRVGAGERLARLETKMEAVMASLDKGARSFEHIRESLDGLTAMVRETHAACIKAEDLQAAERRVKARVEKLETFRDRVKRYSGIVGALMAGVVGVLTLFGPARVAEAFRKLWE
jgi:hypothetical protein